jgi:ribonuclease D
MPANAPIAEPAALAACLERWRAQPWIALDTEFVRVKTYYARLCLLQVCVPGEAPVCIDPLAVDITPLLDFLREPQRPKIIHAARQDLEVLTHHGSDGTPPGPVFDTQIAAALCGFDPQTGYAELVEAATGVRLEKRHTRAQWDRRPLSAEELRYAEDDVRYLGEVYAFLSERLAALGRTAWLEEECAALLDPALYRFDPERAYLRLKQGAQLPPASQPVLQKLAAWRERTAQRQNLPRHWVVPDAVLVAIAARLPADETALRRIPGAGGAIARRWGEEILAAVREGLAQGPRRLWPEAVPLQTRERLLLERLGERVEARARSLGLAPSVLATRRDLVPLACNPPADSPVLHGWRYETIGAELLALARRGGDAGQARSQKR